MPTTVKYAKTLPYSRVHDFDIVILRDGPESQGLINRFASAKMRLDGLKVMSPKAPVWKVGTVIPKPRFFIVVNGDRLDSWPGIREGRVAVVGMKPMSLPEDTSGYLVVKFFQKVDLKA